MLEDLRVLQRGHMAFVGDNAVDIVLYISKMLSFQYKVLVYDISSAGILLNIVSPDGCSEFQNIHYASSETVLTELNHSYDLIITFSDTLQNLQIVPAFLLSGDVYIFVSQSKYKFKKIVESLSGIETNFQNIFIVCRGNDKADFFVNKLYISGIAPMINAKIFFICDNQRDNYVLQLMEYNSVFLYEELSRDLKKFLNFIYNRVFELFDITTIPDEIRFKWVM